MIIIDGKSTSLQIQSELAEEVKKIKNSGGKVPHLAAILVGDDGASRTYVNAKVKACERIGFESSLIKLESTISQEDLIHHINELNLDDNIDGFIVQLPLPSHIDAS